MTRFAVLGVPIDSAGVTGGTELAPSALRASGLVSVLGGQDLGDLEVSVRGNRRDPDTGVLEVDQVVGVTREIRRATAEALANNGPLLIIGGCCALVPGAVAGCRDLYGSVGMVHIDGHLDLYDGNTSERGEGADMPLTVSLGLGPQPWVEACGGATLDPATTWILGFRDTEEARKAGSHMPDDFDPPITALTTAELREKGLGRIATEAAQRLSPIGFWVHIDLDVVDPALFFANDAPVPEGLDWEEMVELLRPLFASPGLRGVSLGCYNPEKDPHGANAEQIVEVMVRAVSA